MYFCVATRRGRCAGGGRCLKFASGKVKYSRQIKPKCFPCLKSGLFPSEYHSLSAFFSLYPNMSKAPFAREYKLVMVGGGGAILKSIAVPASIVH